MFWNLDDNFGAEIYSIFSEPQATGNAYIEKRLDIFIYLNSMY